MCLIAVQKAGAQMKLDHLRNAWENGNDDGAGYAFVNKKRNRLIVKKPYFSADALIASLAKDIARFGEESPFVVHLRLATHGEKKSKNTHPFVIARGGAALAHNGILQPFTRHPYLSDTALFAKIVLSGLAPNAVIHPKMVHSLGEMIGGGNKLAILTIDGKFAIVNEDQGHWNDGVWFSNHNYVKVRRAASATQSDDASRWGYPLRRGSRSLVLVKGAQPAEAKQERTHAPTASTIVTTTEAETQALENDLYEFRAIDEELLARGFYGYGKTSRTYWS